MRTIFVSVLALGLAVGVAAQGVRVTLNEKVINFKQGQAMESRGRVLVPLRGVFEQLGAAVNYEPSTQRITVKRGQDLIELTVNEDFAVKNGQTVPAGARAIVRNGVTMVPLRFLSETLGAKVVWDGPNRTVRISTERTIDPPGEENPPPPNRTTGGTTGGGVGGGSTGR